MSLILVLSVCFNTFKKLMQKGLWSLTWMVFEHVVSCLSHFVSLLLSRVFVISGL